MNSNATGTRWNVNASKMVTGSNTTTNAEDFATAEEQTGIQKVPSNVIAFRSASSPINIESLATALVERLLPAKPDGDTYDPRTDSFPPFDDEHVYIVSVPRHEFRLRGSPSVERLIGWLSRVQKLLAVEQSYLGWWRNGDELVFDVSVPIRGDRDVIFTVAYAWGQAAVYHPASSTVLNVPRTTEEAA
jgi:hypothetical protein